VRNRDRVIDFLCGISSEGFDYYFTSYASPASIYKKAIKAGVSEEQSVALREQAGAYVAAHQALKKALSDIQVAFDIEDDEVEM